MLRPDWARPSDEALVLDRRGEPAAACGDVEAARDCAAEWTARGLDGAPFEAAPMTDETRTERP